MTAGQASKIDTTSDAAIAARAARFGGSTPASAQPQDVVEAVAPASSGAQAGGGGRGGGDLRRKLAGKDGKKAGKPADLRKRVRPADEEERGEAASSPRAGRSLGSGGKAGRSRGGGGSAAPVDLRSKLAKR